MDQMHLGNPSFLRRVARRSHYSDYLALIASLLLQLFTGERPNKRVMEFNLILFSGWATAEELTTLIPKYSTKAKSVKKQ